MRFSLAIGLLLAPVALHAQRVSPIDVYQACRHPAATGPLAGDPAVQLKQQKLQYLCREIDIKPGNSWKQTAKRWAKALDPDSFPDIATVKDYAEASDSARFAKAEASEAKQIPLPLIQFAQDSASISVADTGSVRRFAEELSSYLIAHPNDKVYINGTSDSDKDHLPHNVKLAVDRADSLVSALRQFDNGVIASNLARIAKRALVVDVADRTKVLFDNASHAKAEESVSSVSAPARTGFASAIPFSGLGEPKAPIAHTESQPYALNAGTITNALADAVIAQAQEEVQVYLAEQVTNGMCSQNAKFQLISYLKNTCDLFGSATAVQMYVPTLAALQEAIRTDLRREVPNLIAARLVALTRADTVMRVLKLDLHALNDIADTTILRWRKDGTVRLFAEKKFREVLKNSEVLRQLGAMRPETMDESIAVAISLIYYMRGVIERGDGLLALENLPGDLRSSLGEIQSKYDISLQNTKVGTLVQNVAPYAGLLHEAREWPDTEFQREALIQSARAFVLDFALKDHQSLETMKQGVAYFQVIEMASRRWNDAIKAFKTASVQKDPTSRAAAFAELLSSSADMLLLPLTEMGVDHVQIERYQQLSSSVRDVIVALSTHDYRVALLQTTDLFRTLNDSKSAGASIKLDDRQLQWLNFATDVANAQDQNALTSAFKGFIGEGGGYRAKRYGEPRSFFTVNAYLGAAYAYEDGFEQGGAILHSAAFYMPVGLEHVWRRNPSSKLLPRAYSLFAQIVDLGSVAATRLKVNSNVEAPSPALLDIFSPGVFAIATMGRLPGSFGVGTEINSRAQLVGLDGQAKRPVGAIRFAAFVGIDVPLF